MITEPQVRAALSQIRYPGFSRDILSFGLLQSILIEDSHVTIHLHLSSKDPAIPSAIQSSCESALRSLPGVSQVTVLVENLPAPAAPPAPKPTPIEGVRRVLAIASGKGGVGKSTVAANLALALAASGAKAGLCDCDIYGPSIAHLFGSRERPMANDADQILPIEVANVKLMSMGFILDDNSPAVLRGPLVTRTTQQFLRQVAWGELDYLLLDLPPGTGDIQLTVVQTVELAGAILVTTPQETALLDVRKAAALFTKVNVPILGVLENMSYFLCPDNGKRYDIFGSGGGAREAQRLGVPLLGEIPLDMETREAGESGRPIVAARPQSPVSRAFLSVAAALREKMSESTIGAPKAR